MELLQKSGRKGNYKHAGTDDVEYGIDQSRRKGKVDEMENTMDKEVKNSKKDTSKYLNPVVSWGVFGGALTVAIVAALVVILPLV